MRRADIDVLMITYNRPTYTRRALRHLLDSCDNEVRVWLWHNGDDEETLRVVNEYRGHPSLYRLHHSVDNCKLTVPTNWLWTEAKGELVAKVDDDILMPDGWIDTLRRAHCDAESFGAISCWNYDRSDFNENAARHKVRSFVNEHRLLVHPWIGGGSYVMKRACVRDIGLLGPSEGFPSYCNRLSWAGWINGWYFPLLFADHMDDPRSSYTELRSDSDVISKAPLTARNNGATTIEEWVGLIQRAARSVQEAPPEPARFFRIRRRIYQIGRWLAKAAADPRGRRQYHGV